MTKPKPLSIAKLCTICDPSQFTFETTADLEEIINTIGQDRALQAINFGVGIKKDGYNLYVLGPPGTGKYTTVHAILKSTAEQEETPDDWLYVNNFEQNHKPIALHLPPGKGLALQKDMTQLVEDLRSAIPSAFETEEYQVHSHEIGSEFEEHREHAINDLSKESESHNIRLLHTPGGFAFAPIINDEVIRSKDYEKLPEEERKRIEEIIAVLEEKLANIIHQVPQWQRLAREKMKALNREVATLAVENLIEDVKKKYSEHKKVIEYLTAVQDDVVDQANAFRHSEDKSSQMESILFAESFLTRYKVNLLIDNSNTKGAPIVYEDDPIFQNLVGRVEHLSQMGTLLTDFTLIKPGALHLANGGYLILDAEQILLQPYSWEGLKRALNAHEIHIRSLGEVYSLISTTSLEPQPIKLNIKVVLLGDRLLYYLLNAYDPDFDELFKVAADFEDSIARNHKNDLLYARVIATLANREKLLAFSKDAVARIIEQSARLVSNSHKLSAHMLSVLDLMREADHIAQQDNQRIVAREHIQTAIDAKTHRHNRLQSHFYEEITDNTILIDTDGEKIGQINGLSIIDLGKSMFGQPTRISATTRLGDGEIIDIERESKLGGAIHTKGVMILSAFLAHRYAKNQPLSMSATLVFEQSYGMIEGDSASMAELCLLLSSLAEVPILQSFAITGSVNQFGESQAIGGVNEKIEGFFDVCNTRGLNGDQGVIIPAANVKHLMLDPKIINAAESGVFKIYAIKNIDQAMELLTGKAMGKLNTKGEYPKRSVNYKVMARLSELTNLKKMYDTSEHEDRHHTE